MDDPVLMQETQSIQNLLRDEADLQFIQRRCPSLIYIVLRKSAG